MNDVMPRNVNASCLLQQNRPIYQEIVLWQQKKLQNFVEQFENLDFQQISKL